METTEHFDENKLYTEIVRVWGEYGAHAEVYRALCKLAGLPLREISGK